MAGEIELFSDDDGVVVSGDPAAVQRFLDRAGLLPEAQEFDLGRLRGMLEAASSVAETVSGVVEQSALYLKLTPESAQRLRDAGGLMKTKTRGVSHVMLGEMGKKSLKWLQAEDGPASLLTNPAVISGLGGLMSQVAQQTEAQELRAFLVRVEEKLDDARRARQNKELARLQSAAAALKQAKTLRKHGGDPEATWDKVSNLPVAILDVQETALIQLGDLAQKFRSRPTAWGLNKTALQVQGDVALQLAILARCFELQDEFGVLELDYVLTTAPESLDGHRRGLAEGREERRAAVLERTTKLMDQMDAAADTAKKNTILHPGVANIVVAALNATAVLIDDFHAPLGIKTDRETVTAIPWREALRDPTQRRTAGQELGQKTVMVGASAGALAGVVVLAKKGIEPEESQ